MSNARTSALAYSGAWAPGEGDANNLIRFKADGGRVLGLGHFGIASDCGSAKPHWK